MKFVKTLFVIIMFSTCKSGVNYDVVNNFDASAYMGTWYEIARLDVKYERGLNNVVAHYSMQNDGKIKVINMGFDEEADKWKKAEGKIKFAEEKNKGKLKVSFFGPFYFDYNIISIDSNYNYALVFGRKHDYMWILSRDTNISSEIKDKYLNIGADYGVDTSKLIWVNHKKVLTKKN